MKMVGRFCYGLMPEGNALESQQLAKKGILDCHPEFRTASKDWLFDVVNGCGSGWNEKIVPDSIWFLYIGDCCAIHDDRYERGDSAEDRKLADDEFLRNMYEIIALDKSWWRSNRQMRKRAYGYYWVVRQFGKKAFYQKKYTENQLRFNRANNLPDDFNIKNTIPLQAV